MLDRASVEAQTTQFTQEVVSWVKSSLYPSFPGSSLKLDWSPSRRSSRGGMYAKGPGINIAMYWAYPRNANKPYQFQEYPSYNSSIVIGGFYAVDPALKLKAIVCHELAHAIQMFHFVSTRTRGAPHGEAFKHYYAALREQFINPYIPNQADLKNQFETLTKVK